LYVFDVSGSHPNSSSSSSKLPLAGQTHSSKYPKPKTQEQCENGSKNFCQIKSSKISNSLYKKEKNLTILSYRSKYLMQSLLLLLLLLIYKRLIEPRRALHAKWQEASTGQGTAPGLCICHLAV
jgi:hypothetical protein